METEVIDKSGSIFSSAPVKEEPKIETPETEEKVETAPETKRLSRSQNLHLGTKNLSLKMKIQLKSL